MNDTKHAHNAPETPKMILKHPRETRSGESSDRPTQVLFRCGCERLQNKSMPNPKTEKKMIKSPLICVKWEKTTSATKSLQNHEENKLLLHCYNFVMKTVYLSKTWGGNWLLAPPTRRGWMLQRASLRRAPHTNRETRQDQDQGQNQNKDQNPDHNQDQIGCEVRCTRGDFIPLSFILKHCYLVIRSYWWPVSQLIRKQMGRLGGEGGVDIIIPAAK